MRVANMTSVCTTLYSEPSRYNWMLQYYLRAQGLALSWIGRGASSSATTSSDLDFGAIAARFVAARGSHARRRVVAEEHGSRTARSRRRVLRDARAAALRVLGRPLFEDMVHRIEPFAPEQVQGRRVVHRQVVERVGQDLREPDDARLNAARERRARACGARRPAPARASQSTPS